MRRRVLIFALFLLLGAAINVAVAWSCAAWLPHPSIRDDFSIISGSLNARGFLARRGVLAQKPCQVDGMYRSLGRTVIDVHNAIDEQSFQEWFGSVEESGVPLRALRAGHGLAHTASSTEGGSAKQWACISAIGVGDGADKSLIPYDVLLPLDVIWPGFAINTLFYAAIAWLLIRGPFALRRLMRAKRGRCAACGYDLRGQTNINGIDAKTARCPECGAIAARVRA
jgi:hypothetical protein